MKPGDVYLGYPRYGSKHKKLENSRKQMKSQMKKRIHVIGGGTISHVRNHLALCAPAYGKTANFIASKTVNSLIKKYGNGWFDKFETILHLTKMADGGKGKLETNDDIEALIDRLIADSSTKIIFFNPALVDYDGVIEEFSEDKQNIASGKYAERLKTSEGVQTIHLSPAKKIIAKIRKERKDIFLVGFKTTCGATEDEQFIAGLSLMKKSSCNLVLANDTKTRKNMIITPEQARYCVTTDRETVLEELIDMTLQRSEGNFTRSEVVEGSGVPWTDSLVPASLRTVVDHCIAKGAYKPFNGSTVGHFAVKIGENKFLTSLRKSNFNNLQELALVHAVGNTNVVSQGGKPSVGGQSQRIIFAEHPETDCIVHFHCPPKAGKELSVRSQRNFECGSMECGQNTSDGLREDLPGIKCVYLDNHGPNIVFNREMDPQKVIQFIDENFDLESSTDQINRNV